MHDGTMPDITGHDGTGPDDPPAGGERGRTGAPDVLDLQPERTDLPLVAAPAVLDSMVAPLERRFPLLHDVARVRLYRDFTTDQDVIAERAAGADVLLVGGYHVSDRLLRRLCGPDGTVRCIVFCGTGVASYIDLGLARDLGIRVCNVQHYGNHAVAELTFALMLELLRHVGELDRSVRAGGWAWADGDGGQLAGRRLAIVGLGGIGETVARIARAFGMEVSAWRSHVPQETFDRTGVEPVSDLGDLFARADVVSLHLPLLDATRGIITAEHLDRLRPGSMLVNTARAEVIAPGALLDRLRRGDVYAALDVFDHEPLAADDPLCSLPGVILTPHVGWRTDGAFDELTRQMVEAARAFLAGEEYHVVLRESAR